MRHMRKTVGWLDKYGKGRVCHIDFTYVDHTVVWVQYKTKSVAYLWVG